MQEGKSTPYRPRTFCILPNLDDEDASRFAHDLAGEIGAFGTMFLVTKEAMGNATSDQFAALEAAHDYVVYLADPAGHNGRDCVSQAGTILVPLRGSEAPSRIEALEDRTSANIPIELLLLWPGSITPGRTALWLNAFHANRHFHILSRADLRRAARLLTGRGG